MRVLALLALFAGCLGAQVNHFITSATPSSRTAGTGTFNITLAGRFYSHDEPRFDGVLVPVVSRTLPSTMVIQVPGTLLVNTTSQPRQVLISSIADASPLLVTYPFTINPPLRLLPDTNPAPLQVNLGASPLQYTRAGGTGPFSYNCVAQPRNLPPGMTLTSNLDGCVLSGTPTAPGSYTYTIGVSDSGGAQLTRTYSLLVNPAPLTITSTTLPSGTIGVAYSAQLTATGGLTPYIWSLNTGSLPPGLNLATNGQITGTPTSIGVFTFNVRVTSGGQSGTAVPTATGNVTITISPSITIAPTLPPGTVGQAYSAQLTATGGVPPYSWSLNSGTLPPGLDLASNGQVTGTPTAIGSFTFTVRATGSQGGSATANVTIVINPVPLTITTVSVPNGSSGTPYSFTFTASGGTTPYAWSLAGGALPPGLALSAGGVLSGTPTQADEFSFTVRVADSANRSATRAFSMIVASGLTITTTSLPQGTRGVNYAFVFTAIGGLRPYSWSIADGVTPPGLNLNAGTGEFSGVPTSTGTFAFIVRVTDEAGATAIASVSVVVIASPLVIETTALVSGTVGTAYSQTIVVSGGVPPYTFGFTDGTVPTGLTMNTSTGLLSGTPVTAGTFSFTVQVRDVSQQAVTRSFTVTIASSSGVLPTGTVGTPYRHRVELAGATPPVQCSLIAGRLPNGLTLGGDCELSGTPTEATSVAVTIQFRDGQNRIQSVVYQLTILGVLTLLPDTLTLATANRAYTVTFSGSGGTPPYSYAATGLPSGLSLNAQTGVLSGTLAVTGTFSFQVAVTDNGGNRASREYSLVVVTGLTLPDTTLPNGTVGTPYSFTLAAAGGVAPYTFALMGGYLPAGLALESGGRISGTPSSSGGTTFTVRVTDSARATATAVVTVLVPVPDGTANSPFEWRMQTPSAALGSRCVLSAGTPPPGLTLNQEACTLSPRPTTAGTFEFYVRFGTGTQSADVRQVVAILPAVRLLPDSLPAGQVGVDYSATIRAEGGTAPYRLQVTAGSLPPGVSFDAAAGAFSGRPTAPGVFQLTVRATDANRTFPAADSVAYEVTVSLPTAPSLTAPGVPTTANPQDQVRISVESSQGFPVPLNGRLRLTFTPDAENPADDPAVRFSNDQRELTFTLPASETAGRFPISVPAIQVGTTAGAILVTATLEAGGTNLTPDPIQLLTLRVARSAPVITHVEVTRGTGAITVLVTGYASGRSLTGARFAFTAASGVTLQTAEVSPPVSGLFNTWFRDPNSAAFGSRFLYTQPFNIQGDSSQLRSVEVVLTNAEGSSNAVRREF